MLAYVKETTSTRTNPAPVLAVSVSEAARRLGLGRTTCFGLVRNGALRSLKVGARRIVPVSAIDEFLDRTFADEKGTGA